MGLLDNLPFISSLYNGNKSYRFKRSRSHVSESDCVPFSSQTSTLGAATILPQSLDLELTRRLLQQTVHPSPLEPADSNGGPLDDPGSGSESDPVADADHIESPGLDHYATVMTKNPGTPERATSNLCLSSTHRSRGSKRSALRRKGSWGLREFRKLFGYCHSPHDPSSSEQVKKPSEPPGAFLEDDHPHQLSGSVKDYHGPTVLSTDGRDLCPAIPLRSKAEEEPESRKVSDQTVLSDSSDKTTVTVCRRPSKRVGSPITTIESGLTYESSCSGPRPVSYLRAPSSTKTESDTSSHLVPGRSSVRHGSAGGHATGYGGHDSEGPGEQTIYRQSQEKSHLSLETLSQRLFSSSSTQSVPLRQQRATREYNHLAGTLVLRPLALHDKMASSVGQCLCCCPCGKIW
jgi:hypothetical protein